MRGTTGSPRPPGRLSLQREVRVQRLRVESDEPVLGMNRVIRYTSENTGHFGNWGPKKRGASRYSGFCSGKSNTSRSDS